METQGGTEKRRSRFPWARRKSQKLPEDTPMFGSDIVSTSSVDERSEPEDPKAGEKPLKPEELPTAEDSVQPSAQISAPAVESYRPKREVLPFGEQRIAIAVDRSGSTWGDTLAKEASFIRDICSLMSPRNEYPIQVLPWNDGTSHIISMPRQSAALAQVDSGGGTDPRVLYSSAPYLTALKDSRLWFLLTDGEIADGVVQDFALRTAQNQMHGTACVIVVFGSTAGTRPANCNISVGVAVYAVTPDCLFIFFDTNSCTLYNVQCKGCFKALLPNPDAQRMLNPYTQWSDLPTIAVEDLKRLEIPAPRRVTQDEMALQGQLQVNLEELYSGNVPQQELGEIINNDDNLKSIVIAEMTRGRGEKLQGWLQNQYKEQPTLSKERPDLEGKAQRAITDLLRYLQRGGEGEKIAKLRISLRNAHQANWNKFEDILNYYHEEKVEVDDYNQRVHWASSLRAEMHQSSIDCDEPSYTATDMSSQSADFSYGDEGYYTSARRNRRMKHAYPVVQDKASSASAGQPSRPALSPSPPPPPSPPAPAKEARTYNERTTNELFFPGFQRSTDPQNQAFMGKCMLCESESILTLLLKTPPKFSTPNFPTIGSQSALAFPLAMGNFAELDIVSSFLSCDSCALYLVRNSVSPRQETIVDALPLVPFADNKIAWLGVVAAALRGRFQTDDLPTLFVAILDRLISENAQRSDDAEGKQLLKKAVQWVREDILRSIQIPRSLSSSFVASIASGASSTTFASLLSDKTMFQPERPLNRDIFSLRYPLPGFAVIVRLLRDRGTPRPQLELLTFHRLLYHMTETHFRNLETSNPDMTSNLLAELLTEPDLETTIRPEQSAPKRPVTSISTQQLLAHPSGLLDESSLAIFQNLEEFDVVGQQTGPATAVFLHQLLKHAPQHSSPVDVFNSIKAFPSMRTVMNTPFSVTDALASQLTELKV